MSDAAGFRSWHMPKPEPNRVHVWHISVADGASRTAQLAELLSTDEQRRARRYHFERDRTQYIIGRGTLRLILAGYGGIPALDIRFCYGQHGKPALDARIHPHPVCFNLSHSEGRILCGVSRTDDVGIDIEHIRPIEDVDALAHYVLSPAEWDGYRRLKDRGKIRMLYKTWVCKEALIKALGTKLSEALSAVNVLPALKRGEMFIRLDDGQGKTTQCWLSHVPTAASYRAAVAVTTDSRYMLEHFDWSWDLCTESSSDLQ